MAPTTVTNQKSTFQKDANPDFDVKTTESVDGKIQHMILDSGTISLPSDAATETKQDDSIATLSTISNTATSSNGFLSNLNNSLESVGTDETRVTLYDKGTSQVNPAAEDGNLQTIAEAVDVPTSIVNGQTTVVSAGTAVVLDSSFTTKSITVKAHIDNDGFIYVGTAAVDSANGYVLNAGEAISLDIDNRNKVYIDSSISGEGVSYLGVL